jgi:hypothetical protein
VHNAVKAAASAAAFCILDLSTLLSEANRLVYRPKPGVPLHRIGSVHKPSISAQRAMVTKRCH